jgi:hypothetical protein
MFFILRKIQLGIIINVHTYPCKVPLFLLDFNETWIFSTDFRKNSNTKFHRNLSIGSRTVPYERMDWGTDMAKLIFAVCNFANGIIPLDIIKWLAFAMDTRRIPCKVKTEFMYAI